MQTLTTYVAPLTKPGRSVRTSSSVLTLDWVAIATFMQGGSALIAFWQF